MAATATLSPIRCRFFVEWTLKHRLRCCDIITNLSRSFLPFLTDFMRFFFFLPLWHFNTSTLQFRCLCLWNLTFVITLSSMTFFVLPKKKIVNSPLNDIVLILLALRWRKPNKFFHLFLVSIDDGKEKYTNTLHTIENKLHDFRFVVG